MSRDWVACPHCGERIKRDAKSCRHCGSDDRTGWSEATYLDGVDLPDGDDYEDGLEREGFRRPARGPRPKGEAARWIKAAVASLLIAVFLIALLRGFF